MAVISITINESTTQIVSGIPKTISISTNIPSTIFYTLDGSTPTIYSTIYTSTIFMPTDQTTVELNVFASNGVDASPVITETYEGTILDNARLPHSGTTAQAGTNYPNLYPFGSNYNKPNSSFTSPGNTSITVNDPSLPTISSGFDGEGNTTGNTNKDFTLENYSIKYSQTNELGEVTIGVGNLPAKVTVAPKAEIPESSNTYDRLFDPRALVVFQDLSKEDPELPPNINRMNFSWEDSNIARAGGNYFASGIDSPTTTGSFLRSHYNPRDNTMTYYYRDSASDKWIISKQPHIPKADQNNYSGMVFSRGGRGAGMIYQWIPFFRRTLG